MLEGEFNKHLGYRKHQKGATENVRDGTGKKSIRTLFGESRIQVPRDRDGSFNSMLIPKRKITLDGLENVIIFLYAKGMSNSDIESQIREVYNF